MESLGQYLKSQRVLRSVDLLRLSEETKIAVDWLESIESDNWGHLPGMAFRKGFVKSYARSLGLDEDEVMLRYSSCVKDEEETQQESLTLVPKKSYANLIWIFISLVIMAVVALVVGLV